MDGGVFCRVILGPLCVAFPSLWWAINTLDWLFIESEMVVRDIIVFK